MTKHLPPGSGETRLEKHVRCWLNNEAPKYDAGIEGVLGDLARNGCISGMVDHLILFGSSNSFFMQHRSNISETLAEMLDNCCCSVEELFDGEWDRADPLAGKVRGQNRHLLSHLAFEEAARRVAQYAGIEL